MSEIWSKAGLYAAGFGICKGVGCRYEGGVVPVRKWVLRDGRWECPVCGYGIAPVRYYCENGFARAVRLVRSVHRRFARIGLSRGVARRCREHVLGGGAVAMKTEKVGGKMTVVEVRLIGGGAKHHPPL